MNDTNSTANFKTQIFISNDFEKAVIIYYGLCTLLFGTVLNILVIYLTKKHDQFHKPYMEIRAIYASLDIACIWGMIPIVIMNITIKNLPEIMTCLFSDFSTGVFQCTMNMTALIAFERYYFFCQPMKYQRHFNCKNTRILCLVLLTVNLCYMFGTEILYGRSLKGILILCQLDKVPLRATQVSIII